MSLNLSYTAKPRKMTNETTNSDTSVPPFREHLASNWRLTGELPRRIGEIEFIESFDYEKQVQLWLRKWDPFCEGVPLAAYKNGKALVSETKMSDGETLQEIRRQTIPEAIRLELLGWATKTATECDPTLRRLFNRHKISPYFVLETLGTWKGHFVHYQQALETSELIRSEKRRKLHAKALNKAAEILKLWKPISPYAFPVYPYPKSTDLQLIAKTLLEMGPAQRHRPKEVEIKTCAYQLSQDFRRKTKNPLPEYVGKLILAAFPGQWNPAGDVKEAAKKLLKERKSTSAKRRKSPWQDPW